MIEMGSLGVHQAIKTELDVYLHRNPFFTPLNMGPPGRGGENANFFICWWIFMYDSSFCSYLDKKNISAKKMKKKITPVKG